MKLPMSWLREWVETDATPEQVADALTRRGFYVEGLEVRGRSFPGVVVKVCEMVPGDKPSRSMLPLPSEAVQYDQI